MTPVTAPTLSIVIVSFNTVDHLRRCLTALRKYSAGVSHEIVVIDNASHDGSGEMVAHEFPEVQLIRSLSNDGYGTAVNRAVLATRGDWLLLLNPDAEVTPGALEALLAFAFDQKAVGVISPRLLLSNGEPQASARRFPSATLLLIEALRIHKLLPLKWRSRLLLGTYFAQDISREVPWVSGACHLIPRFVWERVGPLTEETFCGFDDLDYCIRVRQAGYAVWLRADSTVIHHCSVAVRGRWSPWEIEQVAIHSAYVVLVDRWPWWRVKAYCAAEVVAWLVQCLRERMSFQLGEAAAPDTEASRLMQRLRLTVRLLFGRETPQRRYQPGVAMRRD